jgi:transcriptional regulator with XRE-family HTH domain
MTAARVSDLVAANVQAVRMRHGWSGRELAARCADIGAPELTASVIANIESGRRDPDGHRRRDLSIDEVLTLSLALDAHPAELLGAAPGWDEVHLTSEIAAEPGQLAAWLTDETQGIVPSLLGGIAECASCSRYVWARCEDQRSTQPERPRWVYYCANGQCPARVERTQAGPDEYVTGEVIRVLNMPGTLDSIRAAHREGEQDQGESIAALQVRRKEAEAKLANLADHPGIDPELLARSLASFDRRISQLRELQELSEGWRLLDERRGVTRDEWPTLGLKGRRQLITMLLAKVRLMPVSASEGEFDPATVELAWAWEQGDPGPAQVTGEPESWEPES